MRGLVLLMLMAGPVSAGIIEVSSPVPADYLNLGAIESAWKAAGYPVISTKCGGVIPKCFVSLPDNSPVSALDLAPALLASKSVAESRSELLDELDGIEFRIDAGTETAADRRRFMKIILKLNGLAKRP